MANWTPNIQVHCTSVAQKVVQRYLIKKANHSCVMDCESAYSKLLHVHYNTVKYSIVTCDVSLSHPASFFVVVTTEWWVYGLWYQYNIRGIIWFVQDFPPGSCSFYQLSMRILSTSSPNKVLTATPSQASKHTLQP